MRQSNLPLLLSAAAVLVLSVLCVLYVLLVPRAKEQQFGPLIQAARADQVDKLRQLLEAGADPDLQDDGHNRWTPLLHAVHKNAPGAVRELLAAGADVNRASPSGLTPLMMAAGESKPEIFEMLLAAGADPHARKEGDETVLTYAVLGGDPAIVRTLLKEAPDLRMRNTMEDWGARGIAWVRGRSEVLEEIGR